jgi:hypothetical protein
MPKVAFFVPITHGNVDSISVGKWRFQKIGIEPVMRDNRAGIAECIGYNVTYGNPFITFEELQAILQQWEQEKATGIIQEAQ